jgi:hypothetical protein
MRMPGLRLPSTAHTRNRQSSARNNYPEAQLAGLHYIFAARRRHHFGARSEKLDDEQSVAFENSEAAFTAVAVSLDGVAHVADIKNKVFGCCSVLSTSSAKMSPSVSTQCRDRPRFRHPSPTNMAGENVRWCLVYDYDAQGYDHRR